MRVCVIFFHLGVIHPLSAVVILCGFLLLPVQLSIAAVVGDVNNDKVVDDKDAMAILRLLVNPIRAEGDSVAGVVADINNNSRIGLEEAIFALREELPPAALPAFASVSLYNGNSPFNAPIGVNPVLASDSAMLVQSLVASETMLITYREFTSPVYFADSSTPRYDVPLPCAQEWGLSITRMKGVPIPEYAEPSLDLGLPVQGAGCYGTADQDNHMVVIDLESRCEYTFWKARSVEGGWEASWANGISLDSTGVFPLGMSTRASGFSFMGGVIWPDELRHGVINHAIAFSYPYTRSGGPVEPATDSDGITDLNDTNIPSGSALPIGVTVQLNPDLDLDSLGLTFYEKTIARALQVYGMILVDTGGDSSIGVYVIDPRSASQDPYAGVLPDTGSDSWVLLDNIPLDQFRVLQFGPQDGDFQDKLNPVSTDCARFE